MASFQMKTTHSYSASHVNLNARRNGYATRHHRTRVTPRVSAAKGFGGASSSSSSSSDKASLKKGSGSEELKASILKELGDELSPKLENSSIFLVGMMGSGKSTVGRVLAEALNYTFVDADDTVEQVAGKSIPEVFADEGEEAFRELETACLREISSYVRCVVATGGGAAVRDTNWANMRVGVSVYLEGDAPLLAARALADGGSAARPMLKTDDPEVADEAKRLADLLATRRSRYELADVKVSIAAGKGKDDSKGASPEEVARRIMVGMRDAMEDKLRDDEARRLKNEARMEQEGLPDGFTRTDYKIRPME